jgi:hypothetical protein
MPDKLIINRLIKVHKKLSRKLPKQLTGEVSCLHRLTSFICPKYIDDNKMRKSYIHYGGV